MAEPTTYAEVLSAARELLLRTSWDPECEAKNEAGERVAAVWPAKSYSLIGAITHVCFDDDMISRLVVNQLGTGAGGIPGIVGMQLCTWEKSPGRTLEDVLGLIDEWMKRKGGA